MKFIVSAMTSGRWIVDQFTDNTEDVAAEFAGYEFQFTENGKVYGYYNNTTIEGTWVGDVNNLTIKSEFAGATQPLIRLNDTWKVTNNTTKLVEAAPFNTTTRTAYLKLVKK